MKNRTFRTLMILLLVAVLGANGVYAAVRYGTQADPLITLMLTEPHIDPETLRQITVPVLVTVGEHDLIVPEETERIISHLPHARQITVPGADHGSYIQGSEIMGRLLLDFFSEHSA